MSNPYGYADVGTELIEGSFLKFGEETYFIRSLKASITSKMFLN